jgi:hypothetical protein
MRPALIFEEHARFAARKELELLKLLANDPKAQSAARRLGLRLASFQPHSHPQPQPRADRRGRPDQSARAGISAGVPADGDAAPRAARGTSSHRQQGQPLPSCPPHSQPQPAAHRPREARPAKRAASTPTPLARDATNARQRRSAARSARRHAKRRLLLSRTILATQFIVRLRRLCRARILQQDIKDLDELQGDGSSDGDAPMITDLSTKRGTGDRPPSSASSSSMAPSDASSSCDAPVGCDALLCLDPPPAVLRSARGSKRGGKVLKALASGRQEGESMHAWERREALERRQGLRW